MPKKTEHDYVSLFQWEREKGSGETSWVAQWRDPRSGKRKRVNLDSLGLKNKRGRVEWAKRKSREVIAERAKIRAGVPETTETPVDAAIKAHLKSVRASRRPATAASYAASLELFAEWSAQRTFNGSKAPLSNVEDMTQSDLADLREWIATRKRRVPVIGGEKGQRATGADLLSTASANHYLREIRAFVNALRKKGQTPNVSREAVADSMETITRSGPDATPASDPDPLTGDAPRKLLEAALRHDAETYRETRAEHRGTAAEDRGKTPRYAAVAPFVAVVLLTGLRAKEALSLRWEYVNGPVGDAEPGRLDLPAGFTKNKKRRAVDLALCPAVSRILAKLRIRAGGAEYVFGGDAPAPRNRMEAARRRLQERFGAPSFTWQHLRQTAGSYLANAPALSRGSGVYTAAAQLGHSVAIAERHYYERITDIRADAKTLDAAMGIEDVLERVIRSAGGERIAAAEGIPDALSA